MRLPTIADTPWKEEFLKGDFHPFVQADTNRDGVQDLVVVVAVAETFSVVVFHGGPKAVTEPLTIMRHSPGPISGVIVENDGTIKPITCYACESEDIFRWNGRTYARGIFLTNETACIASNASVFPVPDKQLPAAYRAKEAGNAIVLEPPAWAGEQLWYKVRLPDAQDVTGFLEAKDLAIWDGPCKP
jgi:hypothetical protein